MPDTKPQTKEEIEAEIRRLEGMRIPECKHMADAMKNKGIEYELKRLRKRLVELGGGNQ